MWGERDCLAPPLIYVFGIALKMSPSNQRMGSGSRALASLSLSPPCSTSFSIVGNIDLTHLLGTLSHADLLESLLLPLN